VNPILKIGNIKLTDAGKYSVPIKNDAGSIRSKKASLKIIK
jgi:hypothetical protein